MIAESMSGYFARKATSRHQDRKLCTGPVPKQGTPTVPNAASSLDQPAGRRKLINLNNNTCNIQ